MTDPRCILLIDDNPDDRTLAMRALRAEFAQAQFIEVGTKKGFDVAFEAGGFDAVVTDYQLRWSDGIQVLKALRERYRETPVVMFTNTGSEDVCAAAMREGLHDYVQKKASSYVMLPAAVRSGLAVVAARRAVREHQKALEQALAQEQVARALAEQADRLKDEFLATLSHELRTPLNAILGWAHVLQRSPDQPETVRKGAQVIERSVKTQARIIEDLLDVSAIVSGKLRLDMLPVDLIPVLDAAVESVHASAEAKGVRIERDFDPQAGAVMGDATRLQQVFWNLLSNSVKFTPPGGTIALRLQAPPGRLEVVVSDNGEGIAPSFLPYVFDRLRQADGSTTRRHGGLGLGLSIAKSLIELHHGQVQAHSAGLGQGSTFTVSLSPVEAPERRRPAAASESAQDLAPRKPSLLAQACILVVDDEADVLELLRTILQDCGAQVQVADSAAQAMALFTERRPDLLLSDIGMPGEDGYSLIYRVRKLEEGGPRVPAIALTAFARAEDRKRALLAGFQLHIAKPVEPGELVAAIASLLGRTGG